MSIGMIVLVATLATRATISTLSATLAPGVVDADLDEVARIIPDLAFEEWTVHSFFRYLFGPKVPDNML